MQKQLQKSCCLIASLFLLLARYGRTLSHRPFVGRFLQPRTTKLCVPQVFWRKAFSTAVDVVRYSPDGRRLAAAGHDKVIDVFSVTSEGLRRWVAGTNLQLCSR